MPNVAEQTSDGTAAFYVKRKPFARLLEDDDSVVVKIDTRDRERRMRADPQTCFITDDYLNYPMMIVRLSNVAVADLRKLLADAWKHVAN